MVRQREHPPSQPCSPKAFGNVNKIKRGTLTFLVMLWGGHDLEERIVYFQDNSWKSSLTESIVWLLHNNIITFLSLGRIIEEHSIHYSLVKSFMLNVETQYCMFFLFDDILLQLSLRQLCILQQFLCLCKAVCKSACCSVYFRNTLSEAKGVHTESCSWCSAVFIHRLCGQHSQGGCTHQLQHTSVTTHTHKRT